MEINKAFFDKDGLLHDQRVITPSENRTLWLVEAAILNDIAKTNIEELMPDRVYANLMKCWDGSVFHALPDWNEFPEQGFSRDNIIAVTAFGLYFNKPCNDMGWHMMPYRRYFQPQDVIWLMFAAGGIWRLLARPLMWFLALNMIYSTLKMDLTGRQVLATDGKILTFIRMHAGMKHSWILRRAWNFIESRLESDLWSCFKKHETVANDWYTLSKPTIGWRCIFRMYFCDCADHPINDLCKEIWK